MGNLYPQLPFVSDETPLSWAARLAALHTGGPLVPFLNDQGIGLDDLVAGRADAIQRLCDRAVQDPAPVLYNTVLRLGDRRYRLRGETFSAELLTGRRVRFCPACLAEDSAKSIPGPMSRQNVTRRGRLLWVFSPVRTCEAHQLPLLERQRDNWDRVTKELAAFVPETDDELRALSGLQPKQSTSPLQDYVVRRLDGGLGPEWLDGQALDQATRASEMIGALLHFGPGKQAAALGEQDWDIAGRAAWPVVSEGQTGVKAALMSCHAAAEAIGHQAFARPGPYGMLQSWLASPKLSKNPGPIRDLLRDHIIETQDVAIGAKLFDEVVQQPRWANIAALAKSERVHPLTLRNILIARKIVPQEAADRPCYHTLVDYQVGRDVTAAMTRAVPFTAVPPALHASRPIVQVLVDSGLLPLLHGDGFKVGKVSRAADREQIELLLARLSSIVEVVDVAPDGFFDLAKSAEMSRVPLGRIVPAIFCGQFDRVCRQSGKPGFDGVLIDPAEVEAKEFVLDPGLSFAMAFDQIGVDEEVGAKLVAAGKRRGGIRTFKPYGQSEVLVDPTSLAKFNQTFVALPQLRKETGSSMQEVQRTMAEHQILPAFSEDQFGVEIYRRSDLKGLFSL